MIRWCTIRNMTSTMRSCQSVHPGGRPWWSSNWRRDELAAPAGSRYPLTEASEGSAMAGTDYQLDILVQGYPGKSVCHGGLGWSTIVLLRGHGRVALMDRGRFSPPTTI